MALVNNSPEMMRDFVSPGQIEANEYKELTAALESGRHIHALLELTIERNGMPWLIFYYGKSEIEIWVPASEFYDDFPTEPVCFNEYDREPVTPNQWVRLKSIGSMGGKFKLLLTGLDDSGKKPRFAASRVLAMEEDRRRTFYPTNPSTGEIIEKNVPVVGDVIFGRVVSASKRSVTVEAAGVEVKIPRREMAWVHPVDCRMEWKPGDVLQAKIIGLETHPEVFEEDERQVIDGKVDMELSRRLLEPRNAEADAFKKGDRAAGVVTAVMEDGSIIAIGNKTSVYCAHNKEFTLPLEGQQVIVEIRSYQEKEDGSKSLAGIIKTKRVFSEVFD